MEQLLRLLENNARLPLEDIAVMLDKPVAEVAAMMDEAAAKGYIKGYKTLVDWEKAGVDMVEAVIELHVSPKKSRGFDEIATTIASFDEVESVLLMSGGYDLQLIIKGKTFQGWPSLWPSACPPWTTCCPPPPTLCCASTSGRAGCTSWTRSTKESVRYCDGLR